MYIIIFRHDLHGVAWFAGISIIILMYIFNHNIVFANGNNICTYKNAHVILFRIHPEDARNTNGHDRSACADWTASANKFGTYIYTNVWYPVSDFSFIIHLPPTILMLCPRSVQYILMFLVNPKHGYYMYDYHPINK